MDFHASALPSQRRADGYESALKGYFSSFQTGVDVAVEPTSPETLDARLEHVAVGRLLGAVHASTAPHLLRAGPGSAALDGVDVYYLCGGQMSFEDERGTTELAAGDIAIVNWNAPFEARASSFEMLALGLPPQLRRPSAPARRDTICRKVDHGSALATCLGTVLQSILKGHRTLAAGEAAVLQNTVVEAVRYLDEPQAPVLTASQQDTLTQVKGRALQLLQLPELTPASLAETSGISIRTLHRLFSLSGTTVCDWLRDVRLERCWNELADPRALNMTVAEVAFTWGFSDLRTFNRAFLTRYGVNPGAVRRDYGRSVEPIR